MAAMAASPPAAMTPAAPAAPAPPPARVSKRRIAYWAVHRVRQTALRHTYFIPATILALFVSAYAIDPTDHNPVHRFIFLSYPIPAEPGQEPGPLQYGKGWWDLAFVGFYTIVLTFTRELVMQAFLRPLATQVGIRTRAKQARFMEQAYTALYFGLLGPAGLWVMRRTPVWYYNTRAMYEGFPHTTHDAYFKFYYLFQAAYWLQQAVVLALGLEERRKDFRELVAHHIITLSLIAAGYRFHFTYIGIAVYTTHDISDFFLATSKSLKYINSPITEPFYFVFIAVWVYMRHYLNLRILWSIVGPGAEYATVGPYFFSWATENFKCLFGRIISGVMLSTLQGLNLFWLFYILRIAYRFMRYREADDDRSEADPEDLKERLKELDQGGDKSLSVAAAPPAPAVLAVTTGRAG